MEQLVKTLKLKPQTRKILAHLQSRGSISPMEALVAYGNSRLAAAIYDMRREGIKISTDMKRDEAGHQYARYRMEKMA